MKSKNLFDFNLRFIRTISLVILIVCGVRCGKGIRGSVGGNLTPNIIAGATALLNLSITDEPQMLAPLSADTGPFTGIADVSGFPLGPFGSGALSFAGNDAVGATNATTLKSLKYFIISIRLCESITISGSGYQNAKNCIHLYKGPKSQDDLSFYNTYAITQGLVDNEAGRYVDLLSDEGKAKLKKPIEVTSDMVGSYNYGMIDFFRVIKTTAEFPKLSGTGSFYTKATTSVVSGGTDEGGRVVEYARVGNTSASPAEETVYMLNNGGVWFPFQQSFVISSDDVKNKVNISMDLVFNPADFASASLLSTGCTAGQEPSNTKTAIYDTTNCVTINMPYVRMSPVPRKSGQKTFKETYLIDYIASGENISKLRVELYYVDSDSEKGIQGVDSAVVLQSGATTSTTNVVSSYYYSQTGSVTTGNATVKLLDTEKKASLEGLVRRTNGTVTIPCGTSTVGACISASGGTLTKSYTYTGETLVSSD